MKKLLNLFLGASLLIPTGAQAQSVGGAAEQVFQASASWVVGRTASTGHFRFVEAYKSIDPVRGTNTSRITEPFGAALGQTVGSS